MRICVAAAEAWTEKKKKKLKDEKNRKLHQRQNSSHHTLSYSNNYSIPLVDAVCVVFVWIQNRFFFFLSSSCVTHVHASLRGKDLFSPCLYHRPVLISLPLGSVSRHSSRHLIFPPFSPFRLHSIAFDLCSNFHLPCQTQKQNQNIWNQDQNLKHSCVYALALPILSHVSVFAILFPLFVSLLS